jgi:hypothetical protein
MSFNMKALAPWLGTAVAVGAGAYNAYQNSPLPMLSGLRNYLKVPQNMAGILGSLAPIASPLIRTAGLPLMFGAYSMLNDPNYLNDLTAGKIPKLAAVMPPIKPAAPAAPVSAPAAAPFVLPDFSSDTSSTFGNITSLNAPRPTGPTISLNAPDPERQAAVENLVRSGTGLANLAGQSAIHRAVKNPVIKGRASGALGAAVNIAELANVPERIAGTAQRPVSDILQSWQESMIDVPSWLNRHHQIQADPKASTGEKALSHVGNAISSPFVSVLTNRLNPVMNAGMAAKGIDDWTGITNAIHGVYPGARAAQCHLRDGQGRAVQGLRRQRRRAAPCRKRKGEGLNHGGCRKHRDIAAGEASGTWRGPFSWARNIVRSRRGASGSALA